MTGMHHFAGNGPVALNTGNTHTRASALARVAVIIPAWQPDQRLTALVTGLHDQGVEHIILVDDGSTTDRQPIFRELTASFPGLRVCRHFTNQGKGRALKTAFQFTLHHLPEIEGVVTADADGQHLPEDILRVARFLAWDPHHAVLGARTFTPEVPFRSRFGNLVARRLFALLTGFEVQDTQTGLRGLPAAFLPDLLVLPGERYEYETVMLAYLCRAAGVPHQMGIQTVYLDQNRGSHFNPLRDSLRIYRSLFRLWTPLKRRPRRALHSTAERPLRTA